MRVETLRVHDEERRVPTLLLHHLLLVHQPRDRLSPDERDEPLRAAAVDGVTRQVTPEHGFLSRDATPISPTEQARDHADDGQAPGGESKPRRSEEHTSERQSRQYLV